MSLTASPSAAGEGPGSGRGAGSTGAVDSAAFALPGCRICGGKGSVSKVLDSGALDVHLCPCTIFRQQQLAAEARLAKLFPGRMREMTFASFTTGGIEENELALRVARNFVENWVTACEHGWTLGFWGRPAAGKTHLTRAMAIALVKRFMITPCPLSVPDLLREQRKTFRSGADETVTPLDRAMAADLLILDDLGAEYMRERTNARSEVDWVDEQLYLILDARLNNNRPTLFTTNLTPSDLKKTLSARVHSRLERSQVMPPLEMLGVPGVARQSPADQALLLADPPTRGERPVPRSAPATSTEMDPRPSVAVAAEETAEPIVDPGLPALRAMRAFRPDDDGETTRG